MATALGIDGNKSPTESGHQTDGMKFDLNLFRKILNKQTNPVTKKSRTVGKIGVWDELEMVYRELEEKDKDYQTAVKIGVMLLDKNKQFEEEVEQVHKYYKATLQEKEHEISSLMSELATAQQEITTKEPKETHMRQQLERLESQVRMLHGVRGDSEDNGVKMMEEIKDLEEQLKKHKKMVSDLREANKELVEVNEKYKVELEKAREMELELNKKLKTRRPSEPQPSYHERARTPTMRRMSEADGAQDDILTLEAIRRNLEIQLHSLNEENAKLRRNLNNMEDDKMDLERRVGQLTRNNQELQETIATTNKLVGEKEEEINTYKIQTESKKISRSASRSSSTRDLLDVEPEKAAPCCGTFRGYLRVMFGPKCC